LLLPQLFAVLVAYQPEWIASNGEALEPRKCRSLSGDPDGCGVPRDKDCPDIEAKAYSVFSSAISMPEGRRFKSKKKGVIT